MVEDKDRIIASLRRQLAELQSKCNALEQENKLLLYKFDRIDEDEFYGIPESGSDEWANWLIEMHRKKEKKMR
jgi:hypothetical protein